MVHKGWKSHKQTLIPLACGVRCEVDKNIASLLMFLNQQLGIETRHSCEGKRRMRGYISMFATPEALRLAHYLLENSNDIHIERHMHPYGYQNLVIRWKKPNQKKLEKLVKKHFTKSDL
jgi:hypothetical protein